MSGGVCCPSCWTWSQSRDRVTCEKCGTPLVIADGRRLDGVAVPGAGTPSALVPAAGASSMSTVMPARQGVGSAPFHVGSFATLSGINWVLVARCITAGYSTIIILGLAAIGLLVRTDTWRSTDAATGWTSYQTVPVNWGPTMAVAVAAVIGFCALFVWLTKFVIARAIFLLIAVLVFLSCFPSMAHPGDGPGLQLTMLNLVVSLAYAIVVLLSIVSPPSRPSDIQSR